MSEGSESNYSCWQDMPRCEKLKKVVTDKIFSDCEFLVGPEDSAAETIAGHKIMFVMESPVFEKMFAGSFTEAKNHIIRIDDILPEDFKNFCEVIYDNHLTKYSKFSDEQLFELYRIADKYLVSSILTFCIQQLKGIAAGACASRLIKLFKFAGEMEHKILLDFIIKNMSKCDVNQILDSNINNFQPDLFYEYILAVSQLRKSQFDYELKKYSLLLSPKLLFVAIESYFKHNCINEIEDPKKIDMSYSNKTVSNRMDSQKTIELTDQTNLKQSKKFTSISDFKKQILKLVKFEEMPIIDFINGPGESDLLEIQEKYKILRNYHLNEHLYHLKEHLCAKQRGRRDRNY